MAKQKKGYQALLCLLWLHPLWFGGSGQYGICVVSALASRLSVCAGSTPDGLTDWQDFSSNVIFVDVNTSVCGFAETPVYVTSMGGATSHWESKGSSEIYSPTAAGFRIYLELNGISTSLANERGYHINWIADSSGSADSSGFCSGSGSAWAFYNDEAMIGDVDSSECGFQKTPVYVTSMTGTSDHFASTGSSEVYSPSNTGFQNIIFFDNWKAISHLDQWSINWIALDPSRHFDNACSGSTPPGATAWETCGSGCITIRIDTACGFGCKPVYVTSLAGSLGLSESTGSSELYYLPSDAAGFSVYISTDATPDQANLWQWHVNWVAVEATATATASILQADCPPDFPFRDVNVATTCYNNEGYANAGSGPCSSWCIFDPCIDNSHVGFCESYTICQVKAAYEIVGTGTECGDFVIPLSSATSDPQTCANLAATDTRCSVYFEVRIDSTHCRCQPVGRACLEREDRNTVLYRILQVSSTTTVRSSTFTVTSSTQTVATATSSSTTSTNSTTTTTTSEAAALITDEEFPYIVVIVPACLIGVCTTLACTAVALRRLHNKVSQRNQGKGEDETVSNAKDAQQQQPGGAGTAASSGPQEEQKKDAAGGQSGGPGEQKHLHQCLPAWKWCVTLDQVYDLVREVEERYPEADPSVYQVVKDMIKPMTMHAGCSYALMVNPKGLNVQSFITHAWAEGMKAFASALCQAKVTGGLWICFLANPQTWERSELSALLGSNPYMSPFFTALEKAASVVAVRNSNQNMYTRLWCVFELWAAHEAGKRVHVVGPNPEMIAPNKTGYYATCSNDHDTNMLRTSIDLSGARERIGAYVGQVIFAVAAEEAECPGLEETGCLQKARRVAL